MQFPSFDIERRLLHDGHEFIAGVDEAGRGALAGPLAVGLVVFHRTTIESQGESFLGIRDSKQLPPRKRALLFPEIGRAALASDVALVSHRTIDRTNINEATLRGLRTLLARVKPSPTVVIMDGSFSFDAGITFLPVVKGDRISVSIAAASILAKVQRDTVMERLDRLYPAYGFTGHKGYGTRRHIDAIMAHGASPVHRTSYEPLRSRVLLRGGS